MDNEWKILLTGDIHIKNKPENGFISDEFSRIISEHELVSCNFETPVQTDFAKPVPKTASPHLFQSKEAPDIVKKAGFNVIALATNHMYDYGQDALKATLDAFNGQITVGAGLDFDSAYKLKTTEVKGTKVGFLAFCESEFGALTDSRLNRGGYAWVGHPSVFRIVSESRKVVDVLIVQIHGGCEHTKLPVPEIRDLYQEFIKMGADAVIAHHPHVPQGWEIFEGKPVFYSLGNFYFDSKNNYALWNNGYAVSISFKGASFESFKIIPTEKTASGVIISKDESYMEYLNDLSEKIKDKNYYNLADKQVLNHWDNHYSSNFLTTLLPENSFGKLIYRIMRKFIKITKITFINRLRLLHILRAETHRWNMQRALSLMAEKEFYIKNK